MAAFDPSADLRGDRALRLMINTPVTLFRRRQFLDETIAWLTEHGYQVTRLDAARWAAEADMHRDLAAALSFPAYYGHNLDALNDCLRDVAGQVYGWAPQTTGLVLVFLGYHAFAESFPGPAQAVLDIIAGHSRAASLFGRRLLCLVHSADPRISFEPVGACPVMWNEAEWLDASRRDD